MAKNNNKTKSMPRINFENGKKLRNSVVKIVSYGKIYIAPSHYRRENKRKINK